MNNKNSKNVYRDFTYMSDEAVCAIENMEDFSELDVIFNDDTNYRLLALSRLEEDALLVQDFGFGVEATF